MIKSYTCNFAFGAPNFKHDKYKKPTKWPQKIIFLIAIWNEFCNLQKIDGYNLIKFIQWTFLNINISIIYSYLFNKSISLLNDS